ncbi:MAG: hypothetical protein IJ418_14160 [Clostridia bacterium]|nr:hypothetical protein [Clostridia bacterium]
MASNRSRSRKESSKIAFCGLMVALSVVLMLTGGLIPVATYCAPMAGGLLLLPILLEYGKKAAWTAYAAVSLITLLLGVDKEAAFFYLFLGYYPLLKWEIERIKNRRLHLPCKLLVFNVAVIAMYLVLGFLLNMQALVQEFTQMGAVLLIVFLIMLNFCLLLYDRLLFPMIYLYANKIKPRLRFLH